MLAAGRRDLREVGEEHAAAPDTQPVADDQLVAAIRSGDGRVARRLYTQLLPVVDRVLAKTCGGRGDDHHDRVQIVMEKVVVSVLEGRYDGRMSLRSWASLIAVSTGVDGLRAHYRQRRVFAGVSSEVASEGVAAAEPYCHDGERHLAARSALRDVRQLLSQLKPEQASVLVLHDALGYRIDEIAKLRSETSTAVQSRLVRARKKLTRLARWR